MTYGKSVSKPKKVISQAKKKVWSNSHVEPTYLRHKE